MIELEEPWSTPAVGAWADRRLPLERIVLRWVCVGPRRIGMRLLIVLELIVFGYDTSSLAADCLADCQLFIVTNFHVQSAIWGLFALPWYSFLGQSFSIYRSSFLGRQTQLRFCSLSL